MVSHCANLLTRPDPAQSFSPTDHRLLCNRLPGTYALPMRAPPINDPSKLACSFPQEAAWISPNVRASSPQGMEADSSPTARFDEHRLSKNTMGLVCAFGEQERPTVLVALRLVWSSRSLERKTPSSLPRLHPSTERRQPSTSHRMTSQGCRKTLSGTSSPWLASINFT